jgi:hypothetical protein
MHSFGGTIAAMNMDGGGAVLRLTFRHAQGAAAVEDSVAASQTIGETVLNE